MQFQTKLPELKLEDLDNEWISEFGKSDRAGTFLQSVWDEITETEFMDALKCTPKDKATGASQISG